MPIKKIKKRNGRIETFDQSRITQAIFKAITAVKKEDGKLAKKLSDKVVRILERRFKDKIPTVENIQDTIEEVLILENLVDVAKAFILYREQRRRIREAIKASEEAIDKIDQYLEKLDWEVQENANMAFSLQGLNHYATSYIVKRYWLNKIYPKEIREAYESGDLHIHNLDTLGPYCMGWDLYDLLIKGFCGVPGKIESKPAKHFNTALMQCVNFLYTLQGECYSEDTQVLTENGWKYFCEVKKGEKVFTLNPKTKKIELQKPYRFYEYDNRKELLHFKGEKIDLLVTPGHRMLVKEKGKNSLKFVEAQNFDYKNHFLPISENKFAKVSSNPGIKKIKYSGKVYCLEVPNHTLYVRRNKKALWCGNCAGAVSFSNFDTLLAPFIKYDNLNYQQVKQALQEFLFNMAIPTRVGFQNPFTNITLDLKPSPVFAKMPVIIGGKPQDKTYSEFEEEMKIFDKALYEVYMEGDAKGRPFSVSGDSVCLIKNSGKIKLIEIGEYIDKLTENGKPIFIKENNCQVLDVRNSNIMTLGIKEGKVVWQKVNFLVRHPVNELLRIWTVGGFNIKVTKSHSVFVLKDGKIQPCEASRLKPGDWLVSPKTIPQPSSNEDFEISLAEEFLKRGKEKGIYIQNVKKRNGKKLWQKRIYKKSIAHVSVFPLSFIKEKLKEINLSQAKINLKDSKIKISNNLKISDELIEFLGWYVAEGSAEKNKKYGGISLGLNLEKEKDKALYLGNLIKKIWPEVPIKIREIKERNLIEVRIHSKLIRRIITEIFGIGNKKEKKVPDFIFELPPEKKKIFLRAYFKGDAKITEKEIQVSSISQKLIYGISTLLKQLDVFHTFTEYHVNGIPRWRINIWGKTDLTPHRSYTISKVPIKECGLIEIVEKILEKEPYFYDSLGRKYKNTKNRIFKKFGIDIFTSKSTDVENVKKLIKYAEKLGIEIPLVLREIEKGEILFLRIKKIELLKEEKMVYDFSTENENFIANQLLVHNTFPIPTINITKDFPWEEPAFDGIFEASAKYGTNYFANYINSEMKPEDVRSMCCRLRLQLTELYNRGGGGLFGAGSKTGCYDEKTEILTENGWKLFKDLTLEDRVFTLTEDNRIEFHHPIRLFEYDYEGKMIHFKSRAFDLLVTPNHRMVVDHKYKGKRMFVEAKDFKPYQHYIPKGGVWEGEEKEWFVLPPIVILQGAGPRSKFSEEELQTIRQFKKEGKTIYQIAQNFNCNPVTIFNVCTKENYGNRERVRIRYEAPPLKIKMDDWLKFFGFWLAEGSTDNEKIALDHGYRVVISQKNKEKREEIKEVLNHLPFNYSEERNTFGIYNKQLWAYLRQFGNKYTKFIPKDIKNLSKRQLKILFDWMIKGDGHVRKTNGQINYWTASKRLADDLQEIILKLGWHATIKERKRRISQIKGREVKTNVVYEIRVHRKTKHFTFTHKERIKDQIREVYYKGKVYCCEVPNHTVYVRRSGKTTWCGNSIGVVTINLPRIGYLSKTKKEFFERLAKVMDLAKESLEIKRKVLENFIEKGLYPYSKYYLQDVKKMRGKYWGNHFSTIGLIGMNECLLNFMGENIASEKGRKFALEVLDFMREKLVKYQEETGNIYNLEQTPAESTSYRLALKDKERYPDIITAGTEKIPYYTNSTQLPVNFTDDIFYALKLQDELQSKYTGGSVLHIFLGERMQSGEGVKKLVKKIFENFKLPYITITPTFSICPVHGYLEGEHFTCPKCIVKQPCEVYSRIVGYYRPVQQWNIGKQQEFKDRKEFKIKNNI
jgi:anaerobic ribonucleoside-triphosphate reductase